MFYNKTIRLALWFSFIAGSLPSIESNNLFYPVIENSIKTKVLSVAPGNFKGNQTKELLVATDSQVFLYSQKEKMGPAKLIPYISLNTLSKKTYSYFLKTVDMNDDGISDIILPSNGGITVFYSNPLSNEPPKPLYIKLEELNPNYSFPYLEVADLNNDGKMDLIGAEVQGSTVSLFHYIQEDKNHFLLKDKYSVKTAGPNIQVFLQDIDGDGLKDILIYSKFEESSSKMMNNLLVKIENLAEKQFALFLQEKNGYFANAFYIKTNFLGDRAAKEVAVADLDLDGKAEIITAHSTNFNESTLAYWTLQNKELALLNEMETTSQIGPIIVEDINQDSRKDVVMLHNSEGLMGVFLQNPFRSFDAEELYALPYGTESSQNRLISIISEDNHVDLMMLTTKNELLVLKGKGADVEAKETQLSQEATFLEKKDEYNEDNSIEINRKIFSIFDQNKDSTSLKVGGEKNIFEKENSNILDSSIEKQ